MVTVQRIAEVLSIVFDRGRMSTFCRRSTVKKFPCLMCKIILCVRWV